MAFFPGDTKLFGGLLGDLELARLFSDEAYLARLLEVEVALAVAQERLGLVPQGCSAQIQRAATGLAVDWVQLQADTERDGFPLVGLLQQLRKALEGEAATYLHWGATTQDILDTALVLQLREALAWLEARLRRLVGLLAGLAESHRHTLMVGRTHSQQALPLTFGLKAAVWLAPLLRDLQRLRELRPRLLVVQLGGAVGTLASLGDRGQEVAEALAQELGLGVPLLPWHTQRDNLAELAGWLSLLSGSLAKMAQDIVLLAQSEVAEVRESREEGRGGSSTMPQKSNPVQSELVVAVARQNAALLASMHQALIQEHERATHGWQLEWLCLPQMLALSGAALNRALYLGENLEVSVARMEANLRATGGLLLAEALSLALSPYLGRTEAKTLVQQAARDALQQGVNLVELVRSRTKAPLDWAALSEEHYLGQTQHFIQVVLEQARQELSHPTATGDAKTSRGKAG